MEFDRQQEIYRITRPCSDCSVLGVDAGTLQAPDTVTGYLFAKCSRKCPSCDDYMSIEKTGCCASCMHRWDEWKKRWACLKQNSLEQRKNRALRLLGSVFKRYSIYLSWRRQWSLRILGPVFKRYSIYLSWRRRRSLRILGPPFQRYATFLVWKRRLCSCFRARLYHKAAKHVESIPKWKEASRLRALVAHEWSTWINSLVLNFEFVAAERLLLKPVALVEEPVLAGLRGDLISRVRASVVLKRVLQKKHLVYIRWTLRKRRIYDVQRMYSQYQRWVTPEAMATKSTKAPCKRNVTTRKITDFFGQPKRAKVA